MSFCDLIQATASSRGRMGYPLTKAGSAIHAEIGNPPLLVFVLIDGLGTAILEKLPPDSFLRSMYKGDLLSVFPSTTASAMTSLATGLTPAEHGIPGRYSFLEERNIHIDTLAFRDRVYKKLLSPETSINDIWPYPPLIGQLEIPVYTVIPQVLMGSPFKQYLSGARHTEGYSDIPAAADIILSRAEACTNGGYLFLYLWELDSLSHKIGPHEKAVEEMLKKLDRVMESLAASLPSGSTLVISADHGHIEIADQDRCIFTDSHPIMEFARTAPFGEPRALHFLTKENCGPAFERCFHESFGDSFRLYSREEADREHLFGDQPLSPTAVKRFGDFIAVSLDKSILLYDHERFTPSRNRGEHGGNLPEERIIPLLVSHT